MIQKYHMDIHTERNKVVDEILNFYLSTFKHLSGSSNLIAMEFMLQLQKRLEIEMKKIISTKSIFECVKVFSK